jgi:Amt family ammonium transporter
MGALDFAGGTVVHVNAGIAAVVAAIVVGARRDFGRKAILPHNVPHGLLGAGLLWFGWFGFNGGSAVAANGIAALAFTNTFLAPMATLVVWMLLDAMRGNKITAVGAATGIVVGLVAITPAAGFVGPMSALAIGAIGAVPSYFMILYRSRTRLDDSLDVWAAHGTGGTVGAILTGVFASTTWNVGSGLVDGNGGQVVTQTVAILGAAAYSAVATLGLLKAIGAVVTLRRPAGEEGIGMDVILHGEEGYAKGEGAVLVHEDPTHGKAMVGAVAAAHS